VVSKTLECEPRRWKIIERVREKFSCRDCEAITEAPAPSNPILRGFAGPSLLAMVLVNKFLLHQPLNRQSKTFAREGIEIDVSTLADRVGACVVALEPLIDAIRSHVMSAERIHADDTTVPVLAKMKTVTGRIWTYVRDDRPFGGSDPPAALFYYSRNRAGEHPQRHLAGYVGLMQADAFDGYNQLYKANRKPAPILEAACWSHGRRKFFDLAKTGEAPIAAEAVRRIDDLFAIERTINGKAPEQGLAVRQEKSAPIITDLEIWMRQPRLDMPAGQRTGPHEKKPVPFQQPLPPNGARSGDTPLPGNSGRGNALRRHPSSGGILMLIVAPHRQQHQHSLTLVDRQIFTARAQAWDIRLREILPCSVRPLPSGASSVLH
jgi:transposase